MATNRVLMTAQRACNQPKLVLKCIGRLLPACRFWPHIIQAMPKNIVLTSTGYHEHSWRLHPPHVLRSGFSHRALHYTLVHLAWLQRITQFQDRFDRLWNFMQTLQSPLKDKLEIENIDFDSKRNLQQSRFKSDHNISLSIPELRVTHKRDRLWGVFCHTTSIITQSPTPHLHNPKTQNW